MVYSSFGQLLNRFMLLMAYQKETLIYVNPAVPNDIACLTFVFNDIFNSIIFRSFVLWFTTLHQTNFKNHLLLGMYFSIFMPSFLFKILFLQTNFCFRIQRVSPTQSPLPSTPIEKPDTESQNES